MQLGISCSAPTMIWLKKWGICCKDNEIFQSPSVQNWETVPGILAPSNNPRILAKEVVVHHLSFQNFLPYKCVKIYGEYVFNILYLTIIYIYIKFWISHNFNYF